LRTDETSSGGLTFIQRRIKKPLTKVRGFFVFGFQIGLAVIAFDAAGVIGLAVILG
jgi:hypothetical protein